MEQVLLLPIPGHVGYFAGDNGTIWTTKRKGGNDHGANRISSTPKRMKMTPDARGYTQVTLSVNGKAVTRKVHALVLMTFVGPCPPKYEACHFPDKTPSNNFLTNLRWDTHKGNINDRFKAMPEQKTKRCTGCRKMFPLERFYTDKRSRDRKQSQCTACHNVTAIATRDPDKKRRSNRIFMRKYRAARNA